MLDSNSIPTIAPAGNQIQESDHKYEDRINEPLSSTMTLCHNTYTPTPTTTTHSILTITLTGPILLLSILSLIISINLLSPSLTTTLLALFPLLYAIHNDYHDFLSLGPGGTPSTFIGYLKITYLRLYALSDPYTPPTLLTPPIPLSSSLQLRPTLIPHRRGPRPTIAGIAPQRQRDQFAPSAIHQRLRALLTSAATHNATLRTDTSCFEKQGLALFTTQPINATCGGEICHVHASDGSLHMNLHAADAAVVLERGWGQRHPLARGGWLGRFVPREFVMVYAPRDEGELRVVARVVEAAAWWVGGREVVVGEEGGREG